MLSVLFCFRSLEAVAMALAALLSRTWSLSAKLLCTPGLPMQSTGLIWLGQIGSESM